MCHLVFLVPLAGIPLFWLAPLEYALPVNILLWVVFGWLGYKVVRAMMLEKKDDFQSLVGTEATVVARKNHGQYLVKARYELWTARCPENLSAGDRVEVTATEGIKLVVKQAGAEMGIKIE
ncbi:MAG: hypothetical protein A2137_07175 [Chloroflexi bacterium RBG_16_58_8]|nr:MAG: hypothetical protein A2137_07175 [Chloroflexi bacterium RBG_16_58_8]